GWSCQTRPKPRTGSSAQTGGPAGVGVTGGGAVGSGLAVGVGLGDGAGFGGMVGIGRAVGGGGRVGTSPAVVGVGVSDTSVATGVSPDGWGVTVTDATGVERNEPTRPDVPAVVVDVASSSTGRTDTLHAEANPSSVRRISSLQIRVTARAPPPQRPLRAPPRSRWRRAGATGR